MLPCNLVIAYDRCIMPCFPCFKAPYIRYFQFLTQFILRNILRTLVFEIF